MMRNAKFVMILAVGGIHAELDASDQLVQKGSTWRYLDNGTQPAVNWPEASFDDSAWASGPAELGYGDGDEATVISFGPDSNNKYITSYFRQSFDVVDPAAYLTLNARVLRDDGIILYLNGVEVVRNNMPDGAVNSNTVADSTISAASEHNFAWFAIDPALLLAGPNVIAAEVHQRSDSSSDVSFDMELLADDKEFVTRGPYLQLATSTSILIRWRTDLETESRVWFGDAPGNLTQIIDEATLTKQHEVELTGLTANTRYFYAVGKPTQVLAGDDNDHFFWTAPDPGTVQPTRIWVLGDSGTANDEAAQVRDAYYNLAGVDSTDVWLMLGDNAYDDGTRTDYQAAVFDMFPQMLRNTVLWPTRGNHETLTNVYYDLFTLPTLGEAGGIASGTEAYYSFDHANIHFICLDSEGSDRSIGGAQWLWLEADLADTDQEWIIAYWHHPPYTKGSHDSDVETKLIEMRISFLPLLEAGGVDLVLSGHSHSYERSYLIDGHYGFAATFDEGHLRDGGDGKFDGDGAYRKGPLPNAGAVYCVAGSSGKLTAAPLNHQAMVHSVAVMGSVILDVNDKQLDLQFLDSMGNVEDYFTMVHGPWSHLGNGLAGTHGIPALEGEGTLIAGDPLNLSLSGALESTTAFLVIGVTPSFTPFQGGVFVPSPTFVIPLPTGATGDIDLGINWLMGVPPETSTYFQYWLVDPLAVQGFAASNATAGTTPE